MIAGIDRPILALSTGDTLAISDSALSANFNLKFGGNLN